jgi:importin subunit alpha-1
MEKIHNCQNNANEEIYMKAYNIIEKYFSDEDDEGAEIQGLAPQAENSGTFAFGANPQQGGFSFANGGNNDSMDM